MLSVTPEQQSIGDAIEQGTATFIKLRQSLGRMDVNCLNGTEKKIVFSTKNLIIDDENSTTTQRTLIKGSITASSDISSSGNITGKTGSFSHIEGNSPLNINLSLGHIQGISRLDFENANLFGNPIFHGDVNIYSQSFLLDSNDSTILRSNDVVGTGGLIEFGDEVNARTRIQGLNVELRGPVTMSSTISSSGTVFANNAQFGSSTVFINGPEGQITASGDISASGTISALTASIAHFIPSNTPAQNNLGNVLDFTFSGSALFTTIPDHVMAAIGQPQQRVEIAAGSITASSGIIASYFHTPHGKVGINTGLFTPTTPSDPDLKVVGTGGGAGAPPAVEVVGDISASGKITGLTGSFGRLEGLSPITFGDDVIINGNLTASNNGAHLGALLVGTGGYDIDETVTIHSESGAYFLEYDPTGVADGAAYIYKSPPAGTIGVNNEHDGSVNGHIGLFLNNASFRIANSGGQLGNSINEASMSFAQSSSLSAIRFQNLPTSKEQAAQIGTGSLWLSGSADDGTSKFLLVYTG